jgi:hypothetical protein
MSVGKDHLHSDVAYGSIRGNSGSRCEPSSQNRVSGSPGLSPSPVFRIKLMASHTMVGCASMHFDSPADRNLPEPYRLLTAY